MKEWARHGNWNARVNFVKQLTLAPKVANVAVYEVKSHQDRILFIRCGVAAVAIDAAQKKNDWSKKDKNFLEAAVAMARAAMQECAGGRR